MMQLSFQNYPQHVAALIDAALAAANPAAAVRQNLARNGQSLTIGRSPIIHTHYPADGRIFLVSAGKAAVAMARAAAGALGEHLHASVIVAKRGERDWQAELADSPLAAEPTRHQLFAAGHPISDEVSLAATQAVAGMLQDTTAHDLVICLISGGASALLAAPRIPLPDWQLLTRALLESGCTINELNVVRRQLDAVKGGGLARWAAPATCVSLILSDVVGNPLEAIGSGPTVAGGGGLAEAVAVLGRYHVGRKLPISTWERLLQVLQQLRQQETPPPANRVHNLVIGDVRQAATAALVRAAQLGFTPQLLTAQLEGEAREVGRVAAALARDARPGTCLILGGETTVTLRGQGRGGRNQELALAAALGIAGRPHRVVASLATDGEDGPTDAAGAIVSGHTVARARERKLDARTYLDRNDSYAFFQKLDAAAAEPPAGEPETAVPSHHIHTGPTGTNVNDLVFILAYPDA
ncbi:MAG: DUF4147 domain-containing protein [Anaerolineales bacterium]|nr:DUF4147 domain-containing protein [Anaerolineales bacterium]